MCFNYCVSKWGKIFLQPECNALPYVGGKHHVPSGSVMSIMEGDIAWVLVTRLVATGVAMTPASGFTALAWLKL